MTDYTPEQWAQIHANAKAALVANPQNAKARAAFQAAEAALAPQRAAANRADVQAAAPSALATLGLGAADVMSFGLGDQVARKLDPEVGAVQQAAYQAHPTAKLIGQGLGVIGPAAAEIALTKLGRLAPTAARVTVNAIRNKAGRLAAKTALNALEGAGYAGAQAAGHTEGTLGERAQAAGKAAPYGAVAGAVLPVLPAVARVAANRGMRGAKAAGRIVGDIVDRVAGQAKPRPVPMRFDLVPDAPQGLLVPPRAPAAGPPSMQTTTPDPLAVPTFQRRGLLNAGPVPEAWQGTTPQAGGVGGHSYSGTYPRPDVPPVVVNAAPAAAALRKVSYTQLQEVLRAPETPKALKDLILAEIQRRGITGPGLLAPR